ncbi:MAG: hypothetical protein APF82_01035 [Sphingomonadales bacterium BRH_c42]|nr:MAG: hypothetical protein APF82_01035 [Sphingomonadales bacterium BRH_c42]
MATIVLSAVGTLIGGPLGGQIGALIGSQIDQALFAPTIRSEGPRLGDLTVQASSYGNPIPRIFGPENRVAGNLIWSTGLVETKSTTKQGGKGGGAKSETTTYTYHVDCAIALCRGPIASVKRIWADGKLFRDESGSQTQANAVRIYTGTETQMPDPTMEAALGAGNCPAHRGLAYVVFDRLELGDFGNRIPNFTFEVEAHSSATVATVIDELASAANVPYLDAARADYLDLRGYNVARSSTIRSVLDPLRTAFFFDASEIEGELQFFPSDSTPIARVPRDDLGAHEFGTDRPADYELQRTADIELPRQILVQHMDPARDYQSNSQRARRSTTNSDADISVELPIVLSADDAKAVAERMASMAWIGRDAFTYQLPITYLHVEAGHKIVVAHADGKDRVVRVARRELRLPGSLLVECKTDGAAVLSKGASAAPALVPTQTVNLPGVTAAHILDLPILRDVDDVSGFYAAGAGASSGWRGAILYRSRDGGVNYDTFAELIDGAVIGTTDDALDVGSPHYWDEANSVTVTLLNSADTLAGVTALQVLNGSNAAVIGGEVMQFRDATLIGPGQYRLEGLLRGRKGTEDRIAGHAAGERFVLLTGGGIYRPDLEAGEVGVERFYKAASVGTNLSDAAPFTFTHSGRWAKPYAPAHVRGTRNGAGDLAMTWIRRTRLEDPWTDGIDAPLGEASEAYEIDILDGATVKRTLTSSTPTATYSAADQVTDFGSAQAAVQVKVYQISARVGRGLPTETTL